MSTLIPPPGVIPLLCPIQPTQLVWPPHGGHQVLVYNNNPPKREHISKSPTPSSPLQSPTGGFVSPTPSFEVNWPDPQWWIFHQAQWKPLPPDMSAQLESGKAMNSNTCNVLVDGSWCLAQIQHNTLAFPNGTHHALRRTLLSSLSNTAGSPNHSNPSSPRLPSSTNMGKPSLVEWSSLNPLYRTWEPYPDEVNRLIEHRHRQGDPSVDIAVMGKLWFSILFKKMLQINEQQQYRHVRRAVMSACWQWFNPNKPGWEHLGSEISRKVENAHQNGQPRIEITWQGKPVLLDIANMRRLEGHETWALRRDLVDPPHVTITPPPLEVPSANLMEDTAMRLLAKKRRRSNVLDPSMAGDLIAKLLQNCPAPSTPRDYSGEENTDGEDEAILRTNAGQRKPRKSRNMDDDDEDGQNDSPMLTSKARPSRRRADLDDSVVDEPLESMQKSNVGGRGPRSKVYDDDDAAQPDEAWENVHKKKQMGELVQEVASMDDDEVRRRGVSPRGRAIRDFADEVTIDDEDEVVSRKPLTRRGVVRDDSIGDKEDAEEDEDDNKEEETEEGSNQETATNSSGQELTSISSVTSNDVKRRSIRKKWDVAPRVDANNLHHQPKGGNVKIFTRKLKWDAAPKVDTTPSVLPPPPKEPKLIPIRLPKWTAAPRVDADNKAHVPGGGNVTIINEKLDFKHVTPKVDANNLEHVPGGGNVVIKTEKLDFTHVTPKVDANNLEHVPGGGNVIIKNEKLDFKHVTPKVDANNLEHVPGGGNVIIKNEKLDFKHVTPKVDANNLEHIPGGGNVIIKNEKLDFRHVTPKVDANNLEHIPGGGNVIIKNEKLDFTHVTPKVDANNLEHVPGGGNVYIKNEKLDFSHVTPKVDAVLPEHILEVVTSKERDKSPGPGRRRPNSQYATPRSPRGGSLS